MNTYYYFCKKCKKEYEIAHRIYEQPQFCKMCGNSERLYKVLNRPQIKNKETK